MSSSECGVRERQGMKRRSDEMADNKSKIQMDASDSSISSSDFQKEVFKNPHHVYSIDLMAETSSLEPTEDTFSVSNMPIPVFKKGRRDSSISIEISLRDSYNSQTAMQRSFIEKDPVALDFEKENSLNASNMTEMSVSKFKRIFPKSRYFENSWKITPNNSVGSNFSKLSTPGRIFTTKSCYSINVDAESSKISEDGSLCAAKNQRGLFDVKSQLEEVSLTLQEDDDSASKTTNSCQLEEVSLTLQDDDNSASKTSNSCNLQDSDNRDEEQASSVISSVTNDISMEKHQKTETSEVKQSKLETSNEESVIKTPQVFKNQSRASLGFISPERSIEQSCETENQTNEVFMSQSRYSLSLFTPEEDNQQDKEASNAQNLTEDKSVEENKLVCSVERTSFFESGGKSACFKAGKEDFSALGLSNASSNLEATNFPTNPVFENKLMTPELNLNEEEYSSLSDSEPIFEPDKHTTKNISYLSAVSSNCSTSRGEVSKQSEPSAESSTVSSSSSDESELVEEDEEQHFSEEEHCETETTIFRANYRDSNVMEAACSYESPVVRDREFDKTALPDSSILYKSHARLTRDQIIEKYTKIAEEEMEQIRKQAKQNVEDEERRRLSMYRPIQNKKNIRRRNVRQIIEDDEEELLIAKRKKRKYVSKNLYDHMQKILKPEFGIDTNLKVDELADLISKSVGLVISKKSLQSKTIQHLKLELAKFKIIETTFDFYKLIRDFLPYNFEIKVIPRVQPGTNVVWPPKIDDKKEWEPILD